MLEWSLCVVGARMTDSHERVLLQPEAAFLCGWSNRSGSCVSTWEIKLFIYYKILGPSENTTKLLIFFFKWSNGYKRIVCPIIILRHMISNGTPKYSINLHWWLQSEERKVRELIHHYLHLQCKSLQRRRSEDHNIRKRPHSVLAR